MSITAWYIMCSKNSQLNQSEGRITIMNPAGYLAVPAELSWFLALYYV